MMPIIPIRNITVYLISISVIGFSLISFLIHSQSLNFNEPILYDNPEDVLWNLDQAFADKNISLLDDISSDKFCNSEGYILLREYINSNYLNTSYRNEIIEKEFLIKNHSEKLIFLFERNPEDRTWSVLDAYYKDEDMSMEIEKSSFPSLSYANYFSSLLKTIEKKDKNYFGIAPGGRLNFNELDSLDLELSSNTILTYKNIIIHNKEKPANFIYVSLKDYSCGNNSRKCGWLIDEIGSMGKFYKDDLFVQFLINNSNYPNLNTPNEINRSIDISSFQDKTLFETQETSIDFLLLEENSMKRKRETSYIVKPGDNLISIALIHGIGLKSLRTVNNLKNDEIYVSQKLIIPK